MDTTDASELLKALGHPLRLRIVQGLRTHTGCNVNDMVAKLGVPQSTVSQALGVLRRAGVIAPQKKGVQTCYRVVDKRIERIIDILAHGRLP